MSVISIIIPKLSDVLIGFSVSYACLYRRDLLPKVLTVVGTHYGVLMFNKYRHIWAAVGVTAETSVLVGAVDSVVTMNNSYLAMDIALLATGSSLGSSMGLLSAGFYYYSILNIIVTFCGYAISRAVRRSMLPLQRGFSLFLRDLRLRITNDPTVNTQATNVTDELSYFISLLNNDGERIATHIARIFAASRSIQVRDTNRAETIERLAPLRCKGMGNSAHLNSPDSCAVCLEPFNPDTLHRVLGCNHGFHASCIDEWLKTNMTCPMCRYNLVSEQSANGTDTDTDTDIE